MSDTEIGTTVTADDVAELADAIGQPSFAQALHAVARTRAGAQIGRFVRVAAVTFAGEVAAAYGSGHPLVWAWATVGPLVAAAVETAYRGVKAPAGV